jgi:hypothetical protein
LSPATTRVKPIRLHQVWQPAPVDVDEDELPDRSAGHQGSALSAPQLPAENASPDADQGRAATRIALRPHDPGTGEEIDKREIVKGYEYGRGQFVTLTPEELKALDIESSKVIDLETFVPRGDLDPVYFDSSYYLYPDGPIAVETLRVIGAAMAEAGVVGLGCESAPNRDPRAFRYNRLIKRVKLPHGWGSNRRRSGPPPRRQIYKPAQYLEPGYGWGSASMPKHTLGDHLGHGPP